MHDKKRRVLVLHTGGTIGMVPSPNGLRPETGVVERAIERWISAQPAPPEVTLIRLEPLIDSANAGPSDWNRLTGEIVTRYAGVDAVLITHGTDTLAFTSSALTMALEGLDKPVILTGSMIPLEQPNSDAEQNLGDALAAASTAEPGVWIQFSGRLLRGPRARKIHSSAADAFSAMLSDRPPRREGSGLIAHEFAAAKLAVLPVAPGAAMDVIAYAADHCDGLILRCYGSGTVPDDPVLEGALTNAVIRQIPVVAVSETLAGGTKLGTYAAGAMLVRHKVIDGRDMTLEAAYAKLMLALSATRSPNDIRRFVETPLCGEFGAPFTPD